MPYEIIKRVADKDVKGLQMGEKHKHHFREDVSFRLPDSEAKQARDIRARFGQDRTDGKDAEVLVARIPDRNASGQFRGITFDEDGNIVRDQ